ncbi:uncharacterized protein EHS24_005105 [Apiotrichum porosum]|uniref:Uncharacterized protein n=1 Tax=Apiotrichum porosum TaxID=105984 RepID=A0A427Y6W8_9TREE|nr:uncharacterized protein EHS24_005105 [Apiotrichum porosum]RSH86830.1 hypothetical protein EHS24_005105 [Apiotrichum porosum]
MSTSCPGVEELPDPPAKNKTRNTEAEGSSTTITDQANANVVLPPAAASEMDAAPTAVTINHIFYPHLMDSILQHPDSWLAMRTASKTYYQQVQRLMYRHLAIRYDILPAGETNIEGLGPFYKLLEHTEILDIPLGLPAHDLDWFVDQLENLKAVRLYQFAHRPAPGHVVTNITHWMSVGPGAYFINGDPFDLTSPLLQDMVFIFHAKQDMTTSATSHFQWERFVDVITDIMVRSEEFTTTTTFVDFPTAPKDPRLPLATLKDEFLEALETALEGCDVADRSACLDKLHFLSLDEYASQLAPGEFEADYRL